jgi:hypothetical protein
MVGEGSAPNLGSGAAWCFRAVARRTLTTDEAMSGKRCAQKGLVCGLASHGLPRATTTGLA